LYGRNNAGKSALARAFAAFGASVDEKAPSPFCFPAGMRTEISGSDIAWKGEAGNYSWMIGLGWSDGLLREARYTIDLDSDAPLRLPLIKELELRGEGGSVLWSGQRHPDGRMRPVSGYSGSPLNFVGLVPEHHEIPAIRELGERMRLLRSRVKWLDGVRARPPRESIQPRASVEFACDGSDAYLRMAGRPELVSHVGRFYMSLDPPRELELKEDSDYGYRFRLTPASTPSFRIDLGDTGEGMVQVLPVLVAAADAAREGSGAILAVEEPESHLHPDSQAALARYLCEIAAQDAPPVLVLETHSRVFLAAVQLAVAEGRLGPERVSLVWVDQNIEGRSSVTPVELSVKGHPQAGWPQIALAEDLRLASELARVNLARKQ
jgi:hypothetical protein